MVLVDTNVLFDILNDDPRWIGWSQSALENALGAGPITINDIIYTELSTRFASIEDVSAVIEEFQLAHSPMPQTALFLAGKAFQRYRAQGGTKTGVLSDFFIGAHAAVEQWPLLTRDPTRVRSYFPTVMLIAP
jgi:predicted nucleic acid-binding protein